MPNTKKKMANASEPTATKKPEIIQEAMSAVTPTIVVTKVESNRCEPV
jgi:hypothetical protein